ncbi:hypothetical protein L1987_73806 [Smallanthus sonchifolius]|uniref:Uncharacterized protein n=1 Tax=Smallanthus sonchifolius TaxID=185202 RepID=A0ACB9A1W2_9ASTR|nr:hypothetical protein L1987_73806 [Smallanthus sonchifolius]
MLETALDYQEMKHDEKKRRNQTATNTTFHLMRGGRHKFTMQELLGGDTHVVGNVGLGTSFLSLISERLIMFFKRLESVTNDEKLDFHGHMMLLGNLSHPNLLPYLACYHYKDERFLVTDFVINGSLATHLHDEQKSDESRLDWATRLKIIKGVASGLGYLYQEFPTLSLPHGHLKSSSVPVDDAFNPLLTDYGLLPIIKKEEAEKLMVAYKSPEFNLTTKKTDVWCLGMLILEIMTGGMGKKRVEDMATTWVNSIKREEWRQEVFDKNMKWEMDSEIETIDLLEIGLHCCEPDYERR